MEIATSAASSVVEKAADHLVARIGRELGYPFNYRSNISDLNRKIGKLRDARVREQEYVDEANRQGDEIFADVEKWLLGAEELIKETEKFVQDERKANRGCFNLKLRYQQSKKAKNQAEDIDIKIQEAVNWNKGEVAHRPPLPGIGSSSVSGSEVFKSRETTLNEIMEALRDDDIRMVGVWGMGGVGKTTLVQQVAKRAQVAKQANEEKLFDTVVMALNISQSPNVKKIQGEIASTLGLKLEEGDEPGRAIRLSQSLKKHKKILVILDDIWKAIAFETIGIPYGSDDHKVGYCKVLLTSREHHVLSKGMGTHKDFYLQHLCEEEAWSLFKKTAGDSVEKPELQDIATKVVKKCEGLPVAIVTIAKALKGESVAVWRNALHELRRSAPTNIWEVSQNVYSCLELSYNHLKSDEIKSLFLLCGLLGDGDISLDDLLQYGMGLDLFDNIDSLEQATDKLLALVGILKASSLLLDALEDGHYREPPSLIFAEECNGFVRMHDVVRDVAKAIASRDPHRFVVKEALGLQGWQKRDHELENCTRISLNCRDIHELPEGLVFPKLEFFLFNGNYNSLKIPDTFFKEMKEVRVLSLFRIDLTQLPSSLGFLSNLRTLSLRDGTLKEITILGELKKLQVLSLENCGIEQLPEEMMQLTDLRMLSLRDYDRILVPRNVISSLSRLEHLCMKDCSDGPGVDGGGRNAWLSELKDLSCLRALEVDIQSSTRLLPEDVSFENLTRYDIEIGRSVLVGSYNDKRTSRRLRLNEIKGPHLVKCFSKLLKTTEILELDELDDTKHFVYELDREGFLQLKYLSISRSDITSSKAMQYIMNTMEMKWVDPPHSAFPLLEELVLSRLYHLEAVCHGPIPMGCFSKLRVLIIEECYSLKYILWVPTAQGRESVLVFPQLRFFQLGDLSDLIEFYSTGTSGSQEPFIPFFNQQVALPELESLSLRSMNNFRTVWHHQHLSSVSKLKELYLTRCQDLLTLFPSNFLEGLQSLESLKIDDCRSLKEIFEVREINSVRNKDLQGYLALQNLNSLEVGGCTCLKYLFPVSVVKCLLQLEVLKISNCGVEEIVANENGLQAIPIFLFPRLAYLELSKLYQLKRFYGDMYTLGCPLLKTLEVCNCDKVELLFQEKSLQGEVDKQPLFWVEKSIFPIVEELRLSFKGPTEIWWSQFSREIFGKLRVLEIKDDHDISVAIPSSKLQVLHNLEQLTVRRCNSVKEVIQVEGLAGETLPQLTKIHLEYLPMLTHLSGLRPILQNLRYLQVSCCGNLINLVSHSMAKTLVQLEELHVSFCNEMTEIVENKGGEATDDEIVFTKLDTLRLFGLPNLKSFCSARYTFKFPCLKRIWLDRCPEMEFFCKGDLITQSSRNMGGSICEYLRGIPIDADGNHWENDLNTIIQKEFMKTHPKDEVFPDEKDVDEGDSEGMQHPKVEDSVETHSKGKYSKDEEEEEEDWR